jgi:hypothetical protein
MPVVNEDKRLMNRMARQHANDPIKNMGGHERTPDRSGHVLCNSDRVFECACSTGTTALNLAPIVEHFKAADTARKLNAIVKDRASKKALSWSKALRFSGVFLMLSLQFTSTVFTIMDETLVLARGFSQIMNDPKYKPYLDGTWAFAKPEPNVPKSPL